MHTQNLGVRRERPRAPSRAFAIAASLATLLFASPARAHHGAEVAPGAGGTIRLYSGDTMQMGRFYAGLGYSANFFDRLSDGAIENATAEGRSVDGVDSVHRVLGVFAVGVTNDLTLAAVVPWTYQSDFREGDVDDSGTPIVKETRHIEGLGDLMLLAQLRVYQGVVSIAPIVGLKVPTGEEHRHTGGGDELEGEHQPSSGSFDPLFGLGITLPAGNFSFVGSTLFQWTQRGSKDFTAAERVNSGVGVAYAAMKAQTLSLTPVLELTHEWEGAPKQDGVRLGDKAGWKLEIAPGLRVVLGPVNLAVSVGVPILQHHAGVQSDQLVDLLAVGGVTF